MADRTPILDFSKARDGVSDVAVSETGARAVGEAPRPKSSRPSVKGRKRASASGGSSSASRKRAAAKGERTVAQSPEAAESQTPSKPRAKSPAQKRAERKAAPAASERKRTASESKGKARSGGEGGSRVPKSRARKPEGQGGGRTPAQEGAVESRESASVNVASRKPDQKAGQDKDLSTAITGALIDAAAAVVEFARKPHSRAFKRAVVAIACLVVASAFIYPSASDYYVSIRNRDRAQAEYAALQEYHSTLQDQVQYMESDQGIEDRARDQYGMVMGGENSYNVDDLDSESSFDQDPTDVGIIPKGSVKAPEKWYTSFLDPFFGYED